MAAAPAYVLATPLRSTGAAQWHLARTSEAPGRPAIVRTRHRQPGDRDGLLDRLEERSLLASRIHHRGLVEVLETHREGDRVWTALEPIEALTLDELLKAGAGMEKPLPAALGCSIVTELLDSLAVIHGHATHDESALVHGGLEPRRIRITRQGEVKLGGLARELEEPGKPGYYFSAEHLRHERLDPRSDLFSVALLLYELLTRTRPFPGLSPTDARSAILYRSVVPPIERLSSIPAPLNGLILSCLSRERAERPSTAAQLAEQLRALGPEHQMPAEARAAWLAPMWRELSSGSVSDRRVVAPASAPAASRPWLRRLVIAAASLALVGTLAAVGQVWMKPGVASGSDLTGGMQRIPGVAVAQAGAVEAAVPPAVSRPVPAASRPAPARAVPVVSDGSLTLVTQPPVEVFHQRRNLGRTPLFQVALPAGTQKLRLRFPSGREQVYPVTISSGKTTQLRVDLR